MRRRELESFAELAAADLTYSQRGATREESWPAGYGTVHRHVRIGTGRRAFEQAADGLLTWQMHRRAGFRVTSSAPRAAAGVTVALRAGRGPFQLTIPCRVVYTVDEVNRRGFAYGTLRGNPVRGEEVFTVEMSGTGEVHFRVRAFSGPASLLARAGGPLTRLVQRYATSRYLAAMRGLA